MCFVCLTQTPLCLLFSFSFFMCVCYWAKTNLCLFWYIHVTFAGVVEHFSPHIEVHIYFRYLLKFRQLNFPCWWALDFVQMDKGSCSLRRAQLLVFSGSAHSECTVQSVLPCCFKLLLINNCSNPRCGMCSMGWPVPKNAGMWIPDFLPLFCRVKWQNVVPTQSSWPIPATSTMKCGTHRAAKCSTLTTTQPGRREITRHPKRRKGRS